MAQLQQLPEPGGEDVGMHYRAQSDEKKRGHFLQCSEKVRMMLGFGKFHFEFQGTEFVVVHRSNGTPQGTFSTVQYNHSLHIRASTAESLRTFLEAAVEHSMRMGQDEVRMWKFSNMYGSWQWHPSSPVP